MTENGSKREKALGAHLRAAYQDTVEDGVPDRFQALIDENLKRAFDDTVKEGVPDRFAALLAQLKDKAGQ